jgi:hypothetical protein
MENTMHNDIVKARCGELAAFRDARPEAQRDAE